MKKAVIYARVSTDEQVDNYSLSSQAELCRKYASQIGYQVIKEFQDDYSGATPIEQRPEGRKAYSMLKNGDADALIALSIDRIVRPPEEGDEWDMPILIRGLAKLDKEIHTVEDGQLRTDFANLLVAMLKAKSAGDERRKIIERTTRGRNGKARNGFVVGAGKPPYGYSYLVEITGIKNGGRPVEKVTSLKLNEGEAKVVRMIFQWYVNGDETGHKMYLHTIARRLTDLRIAKPREGMGERWNKRRGVWSHSTVRDILGCETYAGTWRFGKKIGNCGRGGKRNPDEHIIVDVPPVVERALWDSAQRQLALNKRFSPRNAKREYLLRGLVRCGCGFTFTGIYEKDKDRRVYRCGSRAVYYRKMLDIDCKEPRVNADVLEQVVWDYLKERIENAEKFEECLQAAQQAELAELEPKRDQLATLETDIAQSEKEAAELALALKRAGTGLVARSLQSNIDTLEEIYAGQLRRRDKLIAELAARKYTDEALEIARKFRADVAEGIQNLDGVQKRRVLELLDLRVEIKERRAWITSIIPGTGPIDLPKTRRKKSSIGDEISKGIARAGAMAAPTQPPCRRRAQRWCRAPLDFCSGQNWNRRSCRIRNSPRAWSARTPLRRGTLE